MKKISGDDVFILMKKYWHLPLLFSIFALALWFRTFPLKYFHIPDIDVYYMIRQSLYLLSHNFVLPASDVLRYYPTGIDPHIEFVGVYYLPSMIYAILTKFVAIDFIAYAKLIPAIFGSVFIIPIYFIGKELRDKLTGVLASFFYAVSPAVMFRTSAGEYEKEAFAILFILISLYYFISAHKKNSLLQGLVSGASILIAGMIWGGVQQVYLTIGGVVGLSFLMNKLDSKMLTAFIPFVSFILLGDLTNMIGSNSANTINYFLAVLLVSRVLVEKYKLIEQDKLKYAGPVVSAVGLAGMFLGSLFSTRIAAFVDSIWNFLFYKSNAVLSTTVAEQAPGSWGNFESLLGIESSRGLLDLGFLTNLFDLWVIGFIGIILIVYKTQKEKDLFFWFGIFSALISLFAYSALLKKGSIPLQVIYLITLSIATASVLRNNFTAGTIIFLIYSSMLSYASYIRLLILVGIYLSFPAGYALEEVFHTLQNNLHKLHGKWWHHQKQFYRFGFIILTTALLVVTALLPLTNAFAGYVVANQLGPSYNDNWDSAMKFMKEQTAEDSVILSWWDFGYWFQLKAERASNLDGGNNFGGRNTPTAQFFTGMMNESQQRFYLQKMSSTHILVDSSMIGKFSAMSKIANEGRYVDAYTILSRQGTYNKGNQTVIAFTAGGYVTIWVPIDAQGNLKGSVLLSTPNGEGYITHVCTNNGIVALSTPGDKAPIRGCVILSSEQALFLSEQTAKSPFHSLFFMDGSGLDYVTKVFDNGEVKIYEVKEIERESKEDLLAWWKTHNERDLVVSQT